MKKSIFYFLLMVFTFSINAQLLPNRDFDKMISQDITYAIFGESSPTTGLKVDFAKPEATISGFFQPTNAILFGFDFTGGVTNKNFSLFKGAKTVNAAFEIKPALHWIPRWNTAKYYTHSKPFVIEKNNIVDGYIARQVDSFYIIAVLYNYHIANTPRIGSVNLLDRTLGLPDTAIINADPRLKNLLVYFISKFGIIPVPSKTIDSSISSILSEVTQTSDTTIDRIIQVNARTINDKIYTEYKKYKKIYQSRTDNSREMKIKNAEDEDAWSLKKYKWFTLAPFFRAEKTNRYYPDYYDDDNDTTYTNYFKKDYLLSGGATVFFNLYYLYPQKIANYFKIGTTLSYNNNLSALSSFNYEKRDSFFTKINSITEKVEIGSAYTSSEIKNNFVAQIFAEYYLLPLNTFIPGIYITANLNLNKENKSTTYQYKGNDLVQLAMETGLVFNINDRDKDKSILSLSMYARFEDVTDKKRKKVSDGVVENKNNYLERNLSYGLKVGIPIALPKRK